MFLIRNATRNDLEALYRLSLQLHSLNLPRDRAELKKMLQRSEQSFAGRWQHNKAHAQFVFVMEDTTNQHVIGTSKVFAKHGTLERPHVYLQVMEETARSKTLRRRFCRTFYRLKTDRRGLTEIGGLVLSPKYRRHKERLGEQLSLIRFVYMRAHPTWFMSRVIAELLPPLRNDQSSLWNCYGKKLTQLPYHEADLLSFKNKEFILQLFPRTDLYHDLLSKEAQSDMGQVGSTSKAALKILRRIGFRYANQVDPFDGGPYYIVNRSETRVFQQTQSYPFGGIDFARARRCLIMSETKQGLRALVTPSAVQNRRIYLPRNMARLLHAKPGRKLYTYVLRS